MGLPAAAAARLAREFAWAPVRRTRSVRPFGPDEFPEISPCVCSLCSHLTLFFSGKGSLTLLFFDPSAEI